MGAGRAPTSVSDLGDSTKTTSTDVVRTGQRITYTVGIRGITPPSGLRVVFSDTLPGGLACVPGSLAADDTAAPTLLWTGVVSTEAPVTITYAATVTLTSTGTLTNVADINATGVVTLTRSATVHVNWIGVYLPLVLR